MTEATKLALDGDRLRKLLDMAEAVGYAHREWDEARDRWLESRKHPYFKREMDTEEDYFREKRADLYRAAGIPEEEERG